VDFTAKYHVRSDCHADGTKKELLHIAQVNLLMNLDSDIRDIVGKHYSLYNIFGTSLSNDF
jgi:hypothetical protein